ncbi:MAG: TrmH family RNA methyltransferase [Waddliaceae bacterium]
MKISSLQHPLVKHLVKLRKNRSYRYKNNTVVVEGKKLVSEVCQKQKARNILAIEESLIPKKVKTEESYLVSYDILKKISGVQNPEGILAEVLMPPEGSLEGFRYVVAFDGVGDPGNLGTLLRTALALGWEGAFILNNSCDPYNDKAVRSAKGATFRLPIRQGLWKEVKALIKNNGLQPVAADLKGKNFDELPSRGGVLLVLGSESRGLSEEARDFCEKITIPMSGKMESLNVSVAGGILMYGIIGQ